MISPERIFHVAELPAAPPGHPPGIIALAAPGCVLPGYAGPGLYDGPAAAVHLPATSPLELVDLRATPGVAALTVTSGKDALDTRMAMAMAVHLRALRGQVAGDRGPVITADSPHDQPVLAGLTRVLHFATLNGTVAGDLDRAVWEWLTPSDAVRWFGGPLPDVTSLHERVDALLHLRRLARAGRLALTVHGAAVAATLLGRYWSGRWLLEHHQLVARLIDDLTARETPA